MEQLQNSVEVSNISEWVSLYSDDLYRWSIHKINDKDASKDLVQETFLAAFKSIDKFKGNSQPKTWLFSILNNKIIDYHRKKFREATDVQSKLNRNIDGSDLIENLFDNNGRWNQDYNPTHWNEVEGHLLDNTEFKHVLSNCMNNLPGKWFSAINLKYLEEKEGKAICQELGITPSNFWQILHRAKIQLKVCIEKNWFNS